MRLCKYSFTNSSENVEKVKKMLSPAYSLKLTNIILFFNRGLFSFKKWSYQNVISTLSNVVKIDVENSNFVSKLSNVVQFYVEKRTQRCLNVDLTLCKVATSYQSKNNVEPTLKCLLGQLYGKYVKDNSTRTTLTII